MSEEIKTSYRFAKSSAFLSVLALLSEIFFIVMVEVFKWGSHFNLYAWIFITTLALIATILAWIELKRIKRHQTPEKGTPYALTGLVLGSMMFIQCIGIAVVFCLMAFL